MKWPWEGGGGGRRAKKQQLHVKVRPLKLEGLRFDDDNNNNNREKMVVLKMKWEGPRNIGLVSFNRVSTCQRSYSSQKILRKGQPLLEWEDEFESVCNFSASKDGSFSSWDVSFHVLYGEDSAESKTKLVVLGKVKLNIGELASTMDHSQIQSKLPVFLRLDGVTREATLHIAVSFAEVRTCNNSSRIVRNAAELTNKTAKTKKNVGSDLASDEVVVSSGSEFESSSSPSTQIDSAVDSGLLSWKNRRLSFGLSRKRGKTVFESDGADVVDLDNCGGPAPEEEEASGASKWEVKEVVSRDGKAKLKTNVFLASFDQRSEKAAGESACTALVVVIAHWLRSNHNSMPTTLQFDKLITEGSSLWRKLCGNIAYTNSFPDNHFDLETVVKANLRPVTILPDKSFTGMFSPDKFENLKGVMSFDNIWEEISGSIDEYDEERIYIMSWNDHFFVLKVEADAYYIIDSLGERLFEGCNQAYILKFDDSSVMYEKVAKETESSDEMAGEESGKEKEETEEISCCKGKECCKEFIKRFLAAIPLGELEEEEKKGTISPVSILQRLQIDFNYCTSSSSASSSSSSPASSTSSLFWSED